ncbi:DMT family transporter [Aquabacterium sp. OR-4]|uniref:DMT family transporter n=1 Tax=Aquabacterium sp. OR-4 TaxID=2978127 RepID=UPI0021B3AF63|nr:DMT family transporter [Aquabacterium sp. OR-4]MDT7837785.1 DMT family transporter [Aquabacterium sp. OR-4]
MSSPPSTLVADPVPSRPANAPAGLSPATRGWLLGALGVALFALTIPMTRLASGSLAAPQLPAEFVAIGRAALAGLLAAGWLLAVRAAWPTPAQWRGLVLTASGVVFGFPLFLGWAVQRVEAAHAAVVSGLLPMATAALAALLLRQRASTAFWACAALGMGLVLGFALWKGGAHLQAADGLLLAAVLWGGFGYVMGARLSTPGGPARPAMAPEQVISWVLVASLPVTLPLAAWVAPADVAHVRPAAWGGFVYVAVVSMWLGFFAWYRGLALGGMLRVSQVQLVQPFLSMALAVPLLGEAVDAATVAFALAVMATVALARRLPMRPAAR